MPQEQDNNVKAVEQFLITGMEQLFGTLIKQEAPVLVDAALARIKTRIDSRAAAIVENDRKHGWSAQKQGDPKNDFPGSIQEKRVDNALFIFAHKLGGTLADVGFRDRFSPYVTPLVMQQITDSSSPEEIAEAVCGTLYAIVEDAVRNVAGVAP